MDKRGYRKLDSSYFEQHGTKARTMLREETRKKVEKYYEDDDEDKRKRKPKPA